MELIQDNGHNEMCGGYSYNYEITWGKYGNTIHDVLKEIKEYTNNHESFKKIKDFGYQKSDGRNGNWGIYINRDIYLSTWLGENEDDLTPWKHIYEGDETEEVINVTGNGGWYCAVNFNITTK